MVLAIATRAVFYLSDGVQNGNFATYDYKYLNTLGASKRSDDAFSELNLVIRKFVRKGQKVVLIVDNPPLPNPQDCINRRTSLEWVNSVFGRVNKDCSVPLSVYNGQIEPYRRLLAKLESANAGALTIFDPTDIYCDATTGFCNATRDGRLMYSYTDHISDYASGLVGQRLNEYLGSQ